MLLDNLIGNGQSQSASFMFCGKERVKDAFEIFWRNAASRIGDLDLNIGLSIGFDIRPRFDINLSVLLRSFNRIDQDVQEDLFDLLPIDRNGRQILRKIFNDMNMFFLRSSGNEKMIESRMALIFSASTLGSEGLANSGAH